MEFLKHDIKTKYDYNKQNTKKILEQLKINDLNTNTLYEFYEEAKKLLKKASEVKALVSYNMNSQQIISYIHTDDIDDFILMSTYKHIKKTKEENKNG